MNNQTIEPLQKVTITKNESDKKAAASCCETVAVSGSCCGTDLKPEPKYEKVSSCCTPRVSNTSTGSCCS